MQSLTILGVRVDNTSVDELHERILATVVRRKKTLILNVNIHAINLACRNPAVRTALNGSDLTFCDGAGIRLGAILLGCRLKPRITYADWMWQLAWFGARHSLSFYFLGGREGVAAAAADAIRKRFPEIIIAGAEHGYFDKTANSPETLAVIGRINAAKPHILVTGFGMPAQELWLAHHWQSIDVCIGLTGGAVFDYVSGTVKRGSPLLIRSGFEWLARLLIEPGRLWKRYLLGNPLFLWRVLRYGRRTPGRMDRAKKQAAGAFSFM